MSFATVAVPVAYARGRPSLAATLAAAGMARDVAWAWERRGAEWWLVMDAALRDHAVRTLSTLRPDVAKPLAAAEPVPSPVALADRVRGTLVLRRLAHATGGGVDAADPAVLAAATVPPGETQADLGPHGRWEVREDGDGGETLWVSAPGDGSWADGLDGAWRPGGGPWTVAVRVDAAPAVARAVEPVSPALATSLRAALLLEPFDVNHDLDELSYATALTDLSPDLRWQAEYALRSLRFAPGRSPRGYQQVGVVYARAVGVRAIIGDAPGAGKTLQSIATLLTDLRALTPAAVVTPASVLTSWRDEIARWAPATLHPAIVETSTEDLAPPRHGRVWLLSWDMLRRVEYLLDGKIKTLVLDEAHAAKHEDTQRSQSAARLAASTPHVLALTGTPLENRVEDLWHLVKIVRPDAVEDRASFVARYGDRRKRVANGRELRDDRSDTLVGELRDGLRHVMVRRLKSDVLADLPAKTKATLWLDLHGPARSAYDAAEAEIPALVAARMRERAVESAVRLVQSGVPLSAALDRANRQAAALDPAETARLAVVVFGHLRRAVGRAKVPGVAAWIRDFATTGDSLVVFSAHHAVRDALTAAMPTKLTWTTVDGDVAPDERGARVADFQRGKTQVIFCGLRSASTGITLTRASTVLFAERDLVPAVEEQGLDRCHRLGQRDAVVGWFAMARDTVDERIGRMAERKLRVMGDVIGLDQSLAREVDAGLLGGKEAAAVAEEFRRDVDALVKRGGRTEISLADLEAALARGR